MNIDVNAKADAGAGIFGLPFTENQAKVVYIPLPWDATTSYKAGTNKGPSAILNASEQIDLFDLDFGNVYEHGLFMRKVPAQISKLNREARILAETIISASDDKIKKSKMLKKNLEKVNSQSGKVNEWVYQECKKILNSSKIPIVVGGDHSTPYGAIKAYAEKFPNLGILHFDAHSDTRKAYMGFEHSHASIMYNVMEKIPSVSKLVQVGIRDFCQEEYNYTKNNSKIKVYFDNEIHQRLLGGTAFSVLAKEIINDLPSKVYISFDIDGLDPKYCPHTGTPVPGGLSFQQIIFILRELVNSGKQLVGFDLVEVAPGPKGDEWDANVGMRLLYKMTAATLAGTKQ